MILDDDAEDHELDESFGRFDERLARRRDHLTRGNWLIIVTIGIIGAAAMALIAVFQQ